ncbi:uncharacterized protein N7529_010811 [Penicillium soppii]|uniref:uncharacterized protein n=1 Tax=Penicillium soppii TaxID=69789 RepID=UPI002549589C|nr:uncharacterized protein N7529_010811 [Penicillium soppii]KAJ5851426.1 hypothetical protein N7529_010811 [Penicillium soppii]
MDKFLKAAGNLLPYHLLAYGTLLGTELYQARNLSIVQQMSFVNTKICYKALPMKEFIILQKRLFPVYFGAQVGLTALTAATYQPYSIFSLIKDPWSAAPLAVIALTGCLNWFLYGPRTTTASLAHRANRNFAHNHAMVIHFNAIAMLATIFYGFSLSARLLEGPNM